MNPTIAAMLEEFADSLDIYDCTITTAPRGAAYAAGGRTAIVITHTPTGETVKLTELTPETLKEALK